MKYLRTVKDAKNKYCPFDFDREAHCCADECMAWVEVETRVDREDHSDAGIAMGNLSIKRPGATVRREGPPGSLGVLILDARGYCARMGIPAKE